MRFPDRWFAALIGCLAACAAHPTRGAQHAARAAPNAVCGGFETLAPGKEMPLLDGRLSITELDGAVSSARPHDIMAAPAANETETRLMLERGTEKLVVFSEEVFARPGPDLLTTLKNTDARIANLPMEERTLESGLRAVIVTHPKLNASGEAVPVAHAYTVLPDDTLQVTHVFVNPEVLKAGSSGCSALALRLLQTLKPGSRRLGLGGGERTLDPGYALVLPAAFALVPQRGPDFRVYRVFPVRSIATPTGQLGIYFGGYPSFEPDPKATRRTATLLGQTVTWYVTHGDDGERREALIKRGDYLKIHVFIDAPNPADADELQRVAQTLKATPQSSPSAH